MILLLERKKKSKDSTCNRIVTYNMPFQHNGRRWNPFLKILPFPTLGVTGNAETTSLKKFHVLILGTYCKSKKIRIRIKCKQHCIELHAPIYTEELKLYQASSKRAIIPIGFCKRNKLSHKVQQQINNREKLNLK